MAAPQKRVLFVDDEPLQVRYYLDPLRAAGWEVFFYDDVDTALDQLSAGLKVDAIITDVMMPPPQRSKAIGDDTGLYLLRHLVKTGVLKGQIPVVILTNRSVDLVAQVCNKLRIWEPLFTIRAKSDTPAADLPRVIEAAVLRLGHYHQRSAKPVEKISCPRTVPDFARLARADGFGPEVGDRLLKRLLAHDSIS